MSSGAGTPVRPSGDRSSLYPLGAPFAIRSGARNVTDAGAAVEDGALGRWAMMICRCAWHPRYYGYPWVRGIVSWRGWNVRFTDGICPRCVARFRKEHQAHLLRRDSARPASPEPAVRAEPVANPGA